MPLTSKCSAAAVPALIVPASISKSSGAASRSYHSVTPVKVTPRPAAICRTTLPQAIVRTPGIRSMGTSWRSRPNPMMSKSTIGWLYVL